MNSGRVLRARLEQGVARHVCLCVCVWGGVSLCVFAQVCVWLGVPAWVCVGRSSLALFWDSGERPT